MGGWVKNDNLTILHGYDSRWFEHNYDGAIRARARPGQRVDITAPF